MRIYETIFIVRPEAPDEEIDATLNQVTTTITEGQGTVDKVERWGKRELAYRVKRYKEGHYILVQYSVESNVALSKEIERRLKVTDTVIKYMTVRMDEDLKRMEKLRAKREQRAAKKGARDERSGPVDRERPAAPAKPAQPAT
jgi:small subunit ribosomal protein S6